MPTKLNTSSEPTPLPFFPSCIELKRCKTSLFLCAIFLAGVLLVSCGTDTSSSNNDDQKAAAKVLLGLCQALKQGDLQTAKSFYPVLGNHYTREAFTALTYAILAQYAQTSTISGCQVDSVAISTKQGSETALGTITYTMANGRVLRLAQPMKKMNGVWQAESIGKVDTFPLS